MQNHSLLSDIEELNNKLYETNANLHEYSDRCAFISDEAKEKEVLHRNTLERVSFLESEAIEHKSSSTEVIFLNIFTF